MVTRARGVVAKLKCIVSIGKMFKCQENRMRAEFGGQISCHVGGE
jgi:hypothetical protein